MEALAPVWAFLGAHVYAVVFLATLVDATGLPFPGRLVLVVAGALAGGGEASVAALIAVAAAGAVAGDHLWYLLGRYAGDRPLELYCRLTLGSRRCVEKTTDYYRRFGAATVFLGRFFAGVRIFTSPLAGSGAIPYWKYLLFEIAGAVTWAAAFVLLGFLVGMRGASILEGAGWVAAVTGVAGLSALLAPVGVRLWRRARFGPAALGA